MSPIHTLIKNVVIVYLNNFKYFLALISIALIWNIALAFIPVDFATTIRLAWIIAAASLIVSLFTELALIKGFSEVLTDERQSAGKTLVTALYNLPWFIILAFLWAAIVLTGLAFFVIPGIVFANWLIFFPALYMIENQKGLRLFRASKLLVDQAFFSILVRVAMIVLITIALSQLAARGFDFLSSLIIPDKLALATSIQYSARGIISSLLQPLIPGTLVLLYYELRRRKGA